MTEETVTPQQDPQVDPQLESINIEPQGDDTLTIQDLPTPDEGGDNAQENIPQDAPYELAIDEAYGMDPDVKEFIQGEAKTLGIPADKLSTLLNATLSNLEAADKKYADAAVMELRQEWGAEFAQRAAATKQFVLSISKAAGFTKRDEAFLSSPNGYRLMYGLSKVFSEGKVDTSNSGTLVASKEQRRAEALDMIKNPNNPYYKAMNKVSGVSRADRVAAWKRYNELMGAQILPDR